MTELENNALNYIIDEKQIRTVFQPIISLRDGSILGHEALSRITCESDISSPDELFRIAGDSNRLWDLELLCRTKALEAAFVFLKPPYDKKLFLNVNPNIMHDPKFKEGFTKEFLAQYNIGASSIIFEITERNVIEDISTFRTTIDHYKNQDYRIAIDDTGSGYSGLNLISEVNPNFIKLDINLIRGIDTNSLKFALVKGMVELSKVSSIQVIAEGIETYAELETLVNLGVQYGQGYFIQRPDFLVKELNPIFLQALKDINLKKNHITQYGISSAFISNLCLPTETVKPGDMIIQVYEKIRQDSDSFGYCVIENEIPVGIITKEKFAMKLSGHFGFTLHQNKQISELMDTEFLSVDFKTPIGFVSSMAMSRSNDSLYDFIIVTQDDKYLGTVTIKDLLQRTTELEVSSAKHQNPLSGLPGNVMIEQELTHCILNEEKYTVAYLDIDNFKAYNDVYGFENGDSVIKALADVLRETAAENEFIGHIGGDDFVIILKRFVPVSYFNAIVENFEKKVLEFYHIDDVEKGFIVSANRHGEIERYTLTKLTCVVVDNADHTFKNAYDISETLAQMKKAAKQINMRIMPSFVTFQASNES
jgi:EAL domain-containing protein (putative c-di-GMP-specific phosphodiesterase class I)/GGDEF domain-containing protein